METALSYQMNVFAPTEEIKGRKVLPANTESFSGLIDSSVKGRVLPATPVKIVSTSAKLPHFAPAEAGDTIVGFVEWNVIPSERGYEAGKVCQVSPDTNVMYMEAESAINAGSLVKMSDYTDITIEAATDAAGSIGIALESAANAGELIRVKIKIVADSSAS